MGQLALARFRGDTGFALVARATSTLFGGLVGTALWYVPTVWYRGWIVDVDDFKVYIVREWRGKCLRRSRNSRCCISLHSLYKTVLSWAAHDSHHLLCDNRFGEAAVSMTAVDLQSKQYDSQIVGYSWQDNHLATPSSPGTGWGVAWVRRGLLVS